MKNILFFLYLIIATTNSKKIFAQEFIKNVITYKKAELKNDLSALLSISGNTHIDFKVVEKRTFAYVYQRLLQEGFKLADDSLHQAGFEFNVLKAGDAQFGQIFPYQNIQFLSFDFYSNDKLNKRWATLYIERSATTGKAKVHSVVFPRDTADIAYAFANTQVRGVSINDINGSLNDQELQLLFNTKGSFLKKICNAVIQTCTLGCPSATAIPACPAKSLDLISERYKSLPNSIKYDNSSPASVSLLYNLFKDKTCLYIKTALAEFYSSSIQ